ncbi:MAG TPA: hypothetical protein VNG51_14150, partial [Ktedonobacteraceae bacterium]|nr:hypothetical protein [Ktedonobacteraceae bacterium]
MKADGGGGGGNGGGGTPPSSPPGNGGGWNSWGWVGGFVHTTVTVVKSAADMTLGISSMVNDVQTITSGNASWQAKLWAGADLLLNVG